MASRPLVKSITQTTNYHCKDEHAKEGANYRGATGFTMNAASCPAEKIETPRSRPPAEEEGEEEAEDGDKDKYA
eukprot:5218442-Pyramimonas_sp.AAC.1